MNYVTITSIKFIKIRLAEGQVYMSCCLSCVVDTAQDLPMLKSPSLPTSVWSLDGKVRGAWRADLHHTVEDVQLCLPIRMGSTDMTDIGERPFDPSRPFTRRCDFSGAEPSTLLLGTCIVTSHEHASQHHIYASEIPQLLCCWRYPGFKPF